MKRKSHFVHFVKSHRSGLVAVALVAEMLISPVADYHPHAGAVLAGFIWLVVVLAASLMVSKRLVQFIVTPLAVVWVIARLLEAFGDPMQMYTRLAPAAGLALSCAILGCIAQRARSVPRDPETAIAESFIAYLIIAIGFAQVYWVLDQIVAQPFNQVIPAFQMSTLLYFSMVTMSSVGYGYIAPLNPYVRMVAAFESVIGLFYIAVVVARLVSSYRTADRAPE